MVLYGPLAASCGHARPRRRDLSLKLSEKDLTDFEVSPAPVYEGPARNDAPNRAMISGRPSPQLCLPIGDDERVTDGADTDSSHLRPDSLRDLDLDL